MWFKKKNPERYVIAFCDENDISTKFGQDDEIFTSYESAKNRIFSKVCGWGRAIEETSNDSARISGGWLIIEKIC